MGGGSASRTGPGTLEPTGRVERKLGAPSAEHPEAEAFDGGHARTSLADRSRIIWKPEVSPALAYKERFESVAYVRMDG